MWRRQMAVVDGARMLWPGVTKFDMVTRGRRTHFFGVSHVSHATGPGVKRPRNFCDPYLRPLNRASDSIIFVWHCARYKFLYVCMYVCTVWPRAIKFCIARSIFQGGPARTPACPKFLYLLHSRTQHEKITTKFCIAIELDVRGKWLHGRPGPLPWLAIISGDECWRAICLR